MSTDELARLLELSSEQRRAAIDESVARRLIAILGEPNRTRQRIAAEAIAALVSDVSSLGALLREALESDRQRLRWGAAFTLGRARLAGVETWPATREALGLEDGDQRWAAAEMACRLARAHPVIEAHLRAGTADPSPIVRRMSLYCLRDLAITDLTAHALALLSDGDPGVRLAALSALVASRIHEGRDPASDDVARAIAHVLEEDPAPGVRRAAAATLGRIGRGGPIVTSALERAARAKDQSLARAAAAALARIEAVAVDR